MTAYYNDTDPYCAQWLHNLIGAGLIAPGDVDERDIRDVRATDLAGYSQCHFFAGIAGWSRALRLAGWTDDREVWTGSPPCQEHAAVGAVWNVRHGIDGPRGSLVRPWLDLICEGRPGAVMFENVSTISEDALAEVAGRLEGAGYSVSRSKRSTSDVAPFHRRQRVWVIAYRDGAGCEEPRPAGSRTAISDPRRTPPRDVWVAAPDRACGMADGFPARVAAIRAFGNAIDPVVAAHVIRDGMHPTDAADADGRG